MGLFCAYRWIERFNNKLRLPAKKEEARRMKQFVNDAFAQDPRILQRRAEDKAQRCAISLAICLCTYCCITFLVQLDALLIICRVGCVCLIVCH